MLVNGRSEEVWFKSKQGQRNYYFHFTNDMSWNVRIFSWEEKKSKLRIFIARCNSLGCAVLSVFKDWFYDNKFEKKGLPSIQTTSM